MTRRATELTIVRLAGVTGPDAFAGAMYRRWIAAWAGGALIGVANGVLREATYGRLLSPRAGHAASGVTAVTALGGYFSLLQRRWPIATSADAWRIGACWAALTVLFEFGFGRAVAKQPWDELFADYDIRKGRTWSFVLAWIAVGPAVFRAAAQPARE